MNLIVGKNRVWYPQKLNTFNQGFPATVEEVIKAPLYADSIFLNRNKKEINRLANEALSSVGMEGYHNRLIGRLSTGQQQRVFIAKALINDPAMIFMDEPTAGIDNKSEKEFYNLLYELNKDKGITIIMVTMIIRMLNLWLNRVFCLNDGSIIEKHTTI